MSKRILFAGSRASGHFAYEEALSKGWDIEFVDTDYNYIKRQVADISAVAEKGCDCIIYDTREYLEEAEIIHSPEEQTQDDAADPGYRHYDSCGLVESH